MNPGAHPTVSTLSGLLGPDAVSFLKLSAGLVVMTFGLIAIASVLNHDQDRAKSNLVAALAVIVLIMILSPPDWRGILK
jgi:hypothetical protein